MKYGLTSAFVCNVWQLCMSIFVHVLIHFHYCHDSAGLLYLVSHIVPRHSLISYMQGVQHMYLAYSVLYSAIHIISHGYQVASVYHSHITRTKYWSLL